MSKVEAIRLLHAERCSVPEIMAAAGYRKVTIERFLARLHRPVDAIAEAFRNWRA